MIHKYNPTYFCCEDISLIENYDKAMADTAQMWHCHHRLETHDENGNLRTKFISKQDLKDKDLYFNRPANELIFLTSKDHKSLHNSGLHHKHSEEAKRKISEVQKGVHWWTNGQINVRSKECPGEGFIRGRVLQSYTNNT